MAVSSGGGDRIRQRLATSGGAAPAIQMGGIGVTDIDRFLPDPDSCIRPRRGLRRRRGRAISGPARDPLVLVPDVARAASRRSCRVSPDRRLTRRSHPETSARSPPTTNWRSLPVPLVRSRCSRCRHAEETNPGLRSASSARSVAVNPQRVAVRFDQRSSFSRGTSSTHDSGRRQGLPPRDGSRSQYPVGCKNPATCQTRPGSREMTRCRSWWTSSSVTSGRSDYAIGYLLHPYVCFYTGRGWPVTKCTFVCGRRPSGAIAYRTQQASSMSRARSPSRTHYFPR